MPLTKQNFVDFLKDPSGMTAGDVADLEKLIQKYPYFQDARMLLAKRKNEISPAKAKRYIGKAAVYVTDRTLLKRYIADKLFFIQPETQQKKDSADPSSDQKVKSSAPDKVGKASATEPPPQEKAKTQPQKEKKQTEPARKEEIAKKLLAAKKLEAAQKSAKSEHPKTDETKPAEEGPPPKTTAQKEDIPSPDQILESPRSQLDDLIDEVYKDIEALKQSKARFREWERKNDEDEAVSSAIEKAATKASQKKEPSAPEQKADEQQEEKKQEKSEKPKASAAKKVTGDASEEKAPSKARKKKAESTDKKKAKDTKKATTKSTADTTKTEKKGKEPSKKAKSTTKTKATGTKKSKEPKAKEKPEAKRKKTSKKQEEPTKATSTKATSKEKKAPVAKKQAAKTKETKKSTSPKKTSKDEVISKRSRGDRKQEDPKFRGEADQKKIISEFIDKDPNITPGDPNNPPKALKDDLSEKSTRFHADIASEYLAEIYIEQGKYDRAVEIYESLSLKFPEKQSLFAARIKQLKKK